jgi:uncharacterized protein (TIGR02118 family)
MLGAEARENLEMIKIVFCLRRRPDLTRDEFQTYWRDTHAPLVQSHADALGIRRYVQVHSIDDAISTAVAGPRQSPEPFDGVAELWFDSLDALMTAGSSEAGRVAAAALLEDERHFIDLARSPLLLANEHVVIDGP